MFWLKETTRRWLCRRTFVLCCVAPTLIVGGWIAWTRFDSTRAAYEARLGKQLGLEAHCTSVRFPRPGVTVFHQLDLSPGHASKPVVHVARLEIDRGQDVATATIDDAEIHVSDLPRVWRPLWQQMGIGGGQLRLLVRSLKMDGIAKASPVTLVVQLGPSEQGNQVKLSLRRGGPEQIELASAAVVCSSKSGGAPTIYLQSKRDLPCDLLAAFWPAVKQLGGESCFRGSVQAQETADGWQAAVVDGLLTNVNLNSLSAGTLAHPVAAIATIKISKATVSESRLYFASGELTTGPGIIERPLLEAAKKEFGLTLASTTDRRQPSVKFGAMKLSFELDCTGVLLQGHCEQRDSGIWLSDLAGHALASRAEAQKAPIAALMRTVLPGSSDFLPASQQAAELARLLPLPVAVKDKLR
jgi:hypothetical protein